MVADRFSALDIRGIISLHFDGSARAQKMKMMGGHFMTKAHRLIATRIDFCTALLIVIRRDQC